jgi:hypothetical protein
MQHSARLLAHLETVVLRSNDHGGTPTAFGIMTASLPMPSVAPSGISSRGSGGGIGNRQRWQWWRQRRQQRRRGGPAKPQPKPKPNPKPTPAPAQHLLQRADPSPRSRRCPAMSGDER